jgi:RNA polymerase sigma factor (sigma-70 family)
MTRVSKDNIKRAQGGDAKALEALVRGIQDRTYKLALRMLADPNAAQDATQEILIRVVMKLSTYRGESSFETWTYRVATNYLLTARKVIANDPGLSFQMFAEDLLDGIADEQAMAAEDHVMLNELRIRCTMAMLLCLDREHRAAYVLGDVLEFAVG